MSLLVLFPVRTILQMFLALFAIMAMITVGFVSLIGNSSPMQESIERVTLHAGRSGNIPFKLNWTVVDGTEVYPYYTLHFESKERPFCVNGANDPEGFLYETQISRYSVTVLQKRKGLIAVNLHISNVDILDAAVYVFTLILFDYSHNFDGVLKKEVEVRIPRGPAICEINRSDYSIHLHEVHCNARTGSYNTTITCYQNDKKAPYKSQVTQSGQFTRGIFWLDETGSMSCCSHDTNSRVKPILCKDFTWPEEEQLRLTTLPARTGQKIENELFSLSWIVTDSGSTKQNGVCCSVYYLLLFTVILFVI